MACKGKCRLIIFSGPSGVGKTPLINALDRMYPDISESLEPLVLYNDRQPRPGERNGFDYHFRTTDEIELLRDNDRYIVLNVRDDLQALDVEELNNILQKHDVLFEGNPFVGTLLISEPRLASVAQLSIFMSPLSKEEIAFFSGSAVQTSPASLVKRIMERKLLRRTRHQKGELSSDDLRDIAVRAGSAYMEMEMAGYFDWVIPNHDGEDSENWDAFYYPIGDARKALETFRSLLQGETPDHAERWDDKRPAD